VSVQQVERSTGPDSQRTLYLVVAIVLIALLVFASFRSQEQDSETARKADEYIAAVKEEGLTPASRETVEGLLGADGGPLCQLIGSDLGRALLKQQLANGAVGPGLRPVTVDGDLVRRGLIAIRVYCPDQLQAAEDFVAGLDLADVSSS
jgi:hypothetical protein